MITLPTGVWIGFNALICMATLVGKGNRQLGFALAFGVALITSAALASGATAAFIGIELGLWALQMSVAILALSLRPPGKESNGDVASLALAATIRLTVAMGVWMAS